MREELIRGKGETKSGGVESVGRPNCSADFQSISISQNCFNTRKFFPTGI